MLTHAGYHGPALLKANFPSWVRHLLRPQGDIDLVIFYQRNGISLDAVLPLVGCTNAYGLQMSDVPSVASLASSSQPGSLYPAALRHAVAAQPQRWSSADAASVRFCLHRPVGEGGGQQGEDSPSSPFNASTMPDAHPIVITLIPVEEQWPPYLADGATREEKFSRRDWLRCGCPPYCPVKRATPEYVQGTRWYTRDMLLEQGMYLTRFYRNFLKLDVDIGFFRDMPFRIGASLIPTASTPTSTASVGGGFVAAHTGITYNGHGCSNNLRESMILWAEQFRRGERKILPDRSDGREQGAAGLGLVQLEPRMRPAAEWPVAANATWWLKSHDDVYYTNFFVGDLAFFSHPVVMDLMSYLNDNVTDGFFRYRWTDQSVYRMLLGVFMGPDESAFTLDWGHLRWRRKHRRPRSVFWHGKSAPTWGVIRKWL
jgi:hypothetical protein